MLNLSTLNRYDVQGMYKIYDRWPDIALESYKSNDKVADLVDTDHIVFAGMGGSGAINDLFSAILSETKIHVCVVKGYHLPKTVDSDTLVVATSVSGNTSETLSVLDSARKMKSQMIAFSGGGKMEEYCIKNNIEHRNIVELHSPRASFTAFLYSILKILEPLLSIEEQDILESIDSLEKLRKQISSLNLTEKNPALKLAEWISGIPIIYYPFGLQAAATRFKNSLQENAKMHAMAEDVLEACHNGIVSWEKSSNVKPILLKGHDDHIKTKERWKILKEYFEINGIDHKEIFSVKGSILSKLINLIYLLDYSTIFCAVLSKTDPSPIKSIDFVKNRI